MEITEKIKPRISTITPCFRMKPYLKFFLDELPNQTYFEQMEVVLDHNEPDEEELQWVREFQAKYPGRIKHIITNPVVPIGASMNRCIREASAELLTIWNVDDLRTDNSLELQVQAFDAGADVVYGNFEVVRSFGQKHGVLTDFSKYAPDSEEFTRSMLLGPFMAFRKSLCGKAGLFDEQLTSGADFDLAIRLAFNGKLAIAPGLLGYYLNEGKGASTRPDSKQALDRTVIELRYGIYDKIFYDLVPRASTFKLHQVMVDGLPHDVASLVPNYQECIEKRLAAWSKQGLRTYVLEKLFGFRKSRYAVKNFLKRIYFALYKKR